MLNVGRDGGISQFYSGTHTAIYKYKYIYIYQINRIVNFKLTQYIIYQ